MKNTTSTTPRTTYEHSRIIAASTLRTLATMEGEAGKVSELRRALHGRDRRNMAMYAAMDDSETYISDSGTPYSLIAGYDAPISTMPDTMSDASDIVNVAALAILEALPGIDHDMPHILPDEARKAAFKACRAYIYAQAQRPTLKHAYIEDMAHNDAGEVIEASYIQVTRFYDISHYEDMAQYRAMMQELAPHLTDYQSAILHKRMQGMSLDAIAKTFNVGKPAICNQLAKVQKIAANIFVDAIQCFDLTKHKKA